MTCKLGLELSADEIQTAAVKALGVSPKIRTQIRYRITRRSIDARNDILYRYRVEVYKPDETMREFVLPEYKEVSAAEPVIIVGAGPAGMFAALRLLMNGLKPVILERGKDVHARKYDMAKLSREGLVNEDSNYCFGEGGAGTFSDGKLYTRSSKRGDIREVLHQLVRFGADRCPSAYRQRQAPDSGGEHKEMHCRTWRRIPLRLTCHRHCQKGRRLV